MKRVHHPERAAAQKAVDSAHDKMSAARSDEAWQAAKTEYDAAVQKLIVAEEKHQTRYEIKKTNRRRYLASVGLGW